jgi:hypothetical protein
MVPPKKKNFWIFILIAILVLAGVGFFAWWMFFKPTQSPQEADQTKSAPTETDEYSDWLTFINSDFGYQIKYPKGAEISFGSDEEAQSVGLKNGKACTTINTQYGYVLINAAADNQDSNFLCGRTGVGADYNPVQEQVNISGKEYQANGFYRQDASTGLYTEFLVASVGEKFKFEYGVADLNKKSSDITYDQVKSEILKILKSFQII